MRTFWDNKAEKTWRTRLAYDKDDKLVSWLRKIRNRKILDAGCGPGLYSILSAENNEVTALDLSKDALKIAQKEAEKAGVKISFKEGDVRKLPFDDNSFDIIISAGVMEHLPDIEKAISEASRVLKTGGFLIGNVPYRYTLFSVARAVQKFLGLWKIGYERSFTKREFASLLRQHRLYIEKTARAETAIKTPISFILRMADKLLIPFGHGGAHFYFWARKQP